MKTVWIYHDRVTGTLTGVSPSKSAPTSATVAGVSYDIGTSEATYQLSSQGSFQEGDLVTLLLGMNGEIISVLDAQESEATYYGSVVSSVKGASSFFYQQLLYHQRSGDHPGGLYRRSRAYLLP